MFKKIGLIFKNSLSDNDKNSLKQLIPVLTKSDCTVFVEEENSLDGNFEGAVLNDFPKTLDLLIVFGGDGTFLSSARKFLEFEIPMLGVNFGSVGFLTDINVDGFEETIKDVLSGQHIIEERDLVRVSFSNQTYFGLNEVLIHSGSYAQLMRYKLKIGERVVYEQRSDGLIVATPTGSSAYALSAGGPIIDPELSVFNIIPMMSQSLSSRALVSPNDKNISVEIMEGPLEHGMVCVDGQENIRVNFGEEISLSKNDIKLKIVHPKNNNFYESCREKLGWSLDITNNKSS